MSKTEKTFLSLMVEMTLIAGLASADTSTMATLAVIVIYSVFAAMFVSVD